MRTLTNNKPWKTWFFMRGKFENFTGGWVSCCWVPKRDDTGRSENWGATPWKTGIFLRERVELFTGGWVNKALKNGRLPERKGWALYRRVSEVLLNPSQKGMTQDEVKIVCQGATPWKTGIFPLGRVELFTGGWVSCCWVPKRDDAGKEKNNCMAHKENRKGAT